MSELEGRCNVCRAMVDEEDLFCANCGAEVPHAESSAATSARTYTHAFECQGCGASMSYDARAQALRCPFCGSEQLREQADTSALGPSRIVPFLIEESAAAAALRTWLGQGLWRPGDLSTQAAVAKMAAVYVPYWVFRAETSTYWTADSSRTPSGARASWFPVAGEHRGSCSGLLVGASSVLTPAETDALGHFDLEKAVPPQDVDLDPVIVEQFRVQRKYARPLARQGIEALVQDSCRQFVPGNCRNLKISLRLDGLSSEPVLLPVWVVAYRYRDQVYRFLLNGQTGTATGHAPTSWKKVAAVSVAVLVLVLVLVLCAAFVL
jgi:predicted RNA-binding Zn-ribbon protein involved in translation (DUF1610 family)